MNIDNKLRRQFLKKTFLLFQDMTCYLVKQQIAKKKHTMSSRRVLTDDIHMHCRVCVFVGSSAQARVKAQLSGSQERRRTIVQLIRLFQSAEMGVLHHCHITGLSGISSAGVKREGLHQKKVEKNPILKAKGQNIYIALYTTKTSSLTHSWMRENCSGGMQPLSDCLLLFFTVGSQLDISIGHSVICGHPWSFLFSHNIFPLHFWSEIKTHSLLRVKSWLSLSVIP